MHEQPPRVAEALVRRLVGGRDADAVVGDMREEFAARGGGRLWYWGQALSCLAVRLSPHRRMLPGIGMDFRLALRTIRRNPGYAFTAMVCLALAMGVNTVLFSFLDSMYFRRLPVPEPDRIVTVHRANTPFCTWGEYLGFRNELRSVQAEAIITAGTSVGIGQHDIQAILEIASPNYPRMLRLGTALGRWFTPDDAGSDEPEAVISYDFWHKRFGGDPAVLGKRIDRFRIVGVAPRGFHGAVPPVVADIWLPATDFYRGFPNPSLLRTNLVARLAPGATLEAARAEMRLIAARLPQADGQNPGAANPAVVENAYGFVWTNGRRYMKPLLTMLGAACAFVLLIACANVANLLLSRATVRRREMALRQSLGATRARLFRETLAEGLVLAAGGLALGLLAGVWANRALELALPSIPVQTYAGIQLGINWRVAALLAGAAIASAILFSLPPALQSGRRDLSVSLKGESGVRRARQREFYSFAQVALSLTLLIATTLLLRALQRVENLDPGFDPSRGLSVTLSMPPPIKGATPPAVAQLFDNLLEQARATPGIQDATLIGPYSLGHAGAVAVAAERESRRSTGYSVEPNYFQAMRAVMVKGRAFGASDAPGGIPSVVVNENMARNWWPGEDPIGKPLWFGALAERRMGRVIGVVRDIMSQGATAQSWPDFYISRRQDPGIGRFILIARTAGNPYQWAEPLLRIARSAPNLRISEPESLESKIALSFWQLKWQAALLGGLGLLALVLAAVGLYGVVAFSVAQRTREIGVRMALGAAPGDVQWMALGRGLRITAAGLAAGLLLSAGAVRLLRSFLFGMSPFDPVAFTGASVTWAIIAMLASWRPARRATRVDPMTALKYE